MGPSGLYLKRGTITDGNIIKRFPPTLCAQKRGLDGRARAYFEMAAFD